MGLWCRPRRCATVERKLQQTQSCNDGARGVAKTVAEPLQTRGVFGRPDFEFAARTPLQGPRATSNATSRATWNATSAPMNATSAPSARPADAQGSTHDQQQELFVLVPARLADVQAGGPRV